MAPDEESNILKREYQCFISYRHSDNLVPSRQWATWLHQALESYTIPEDLIGQVNDRGEVIPESIFPIFRDEEELAADSDLTKNIKLALQRSKYLLVLCSPAAVASKYVAEEIEYFKHLGKGDRIVPAIIHGDPSAEPDSETYCFPAPLLLTQAASPLEPQAADFRLKDGSQGWTSPAAYRESLELSQCKEREIRNAVLEFSDRQNLMFLKVVAGIIGVPLGILRARDKALQLRKQKRNNLILARWLLLAGSLAVVATTASLLAFNNAREADRQRSRAEAETITADEQRVAAENERAIAQREQVRAEKQTALAEERQAQQDKLLWESSRSDYNTALSFKKSGDDSRAVAYFSRALNSQPKNVAALTGASLSCIGPGAPPWITRYGQDLKGEVTAIDFDQAGAHLAVGTSLGQIILIECTSGRSILDRNLGLPVVGLRLASDGRLAIASSTKGENASGKVSILDTSSGRISEIHHLQAEITAFDVNESFELVALGVEEIRPELINNQLDSLEYKDYSLILPVSGSKEIKKSESGKYVNQISFNPSGDFVAIASGSFAPYANPGTLDVYQVASLMKAHSMNNTTRRVIFTPSGELMAVAYYNDLETSYVASRSAYQKRTFEDKIIDIQCSPDESVLCVMTGTNSGAKLFIVDLESLETIYETLIPLNPTVSQFSTDGTWLAVGNQSGEFCILERNTFLGFAPTTSKAERNSEEKSTPYEICSSNGEWKAVVIHDHDDYREYIFLLNQNSGALEYVFEGDNEETKVGFSADSNYLLLADGFAATGTDYPLNVIDLSQGRVVFSKSPGEITNGFDFSPDGQRLALALGDDPSFEREASLYGKLAVLSFPGFKQATELLFDTEVTDVKFDSSSRWIYIITAPGVISNGYFQIFESNTGMQIHSASLPRIGGGYKWKIFVNGDIIRLYYDSASEKPQGVTFDRRWLANENELASPELIQLLNSKSNCTANLKGGFELSYSNSHVDIISKSIDNLSDWQKRLCHWIILPPQLRSISPWDDTPQRKFVGKEIVRAGVAGDTQTSLVNAPWHPLQPLARACVLQDNSDDGEVVRECKKRRRKYLARLTVQRLRDIDSRLYSDEEIVNYGRWASSTIERELGDPELAREVAIAIEKYAKREEQRTLEWLESEFGSR